MHTENAYDIQLNEFSQNEHTQIKKQNMTNTPEALPLLPSRAYHHHPQE